MKSVLATVTIALIACASLAPRVADTPAERRAQAEQARVPAPPMTPPTSAQVAVR